MATHEAQDSPRAACPGLARARAALVRHEAPAGAGWATHLDLFIEPGFAGDGRADGNDDDRLALAWRLSIDPRADLQAAISGAKRMSNHRLAWARLRAGEVRLTSSGERCECLASGSVTCVSSERAVRFSLDFGSGVIDWAPDRIEGAPR
ncbi:MAG: hypothetical protein O2819_06625 [Planctomycetota bacterium]|nr:hypothetical protein [Planctomycetota bacterium]MDA1105211.1 hypothetical protein [Planctomycetota bacterium]